MTEEPTYLTELEQRVLEELEAGLPVSASPYCVLAEHIGSTEIDVLNVSQKLRETGAISWLGVAFRNPDVGFCSMLDAEPSGGMLGDIEISCEEAELAGLLLDDLPYGEHPFAELANVLQERGVGEATESWVLDRIDDWIDESVISPPRARRGTGV